MFVLCSRRFKIENRLEQMEETLLEKEREVVAGIRLREEIEDKVAEERRANYRGHVLWSLGKAENEHRKIKVTSRSKSPNVSPTEGVRPFKKENLKKTSPDSQKHELSSVLLTKLQSSSKPFATFRTKITKKDMYLSTSLSSRLYEYANSEIAFSARSGSSDFNTQPTELNSQTSPFKPTSPYRKKLIFHKPGQFRAVSPLPEIKGFTYQN